jgi:hypothetical protein
MNLFDYATLLGRLGETDSAAYWFARAIANPARIDSARRLVSHLELAQRAEGLSREESARAHRAEADRLKPIAARSTPARAALVADRIRAAREGGNGDAVLATIRSELEAMDYAPDSRSQLITVLLGEAAAALIATGRYADALPYVEHLERIGTRDSMSIRQSGVVGRARLLRARIAIGLGDTVRARELIASSLAPLEFGYGALHALTREASALRDSLRSN